MTTYRIVRFFQERDKDKEVITRGQTLEQAQAHCSREDTHGEGWFDGYEREDDEAVVLAKAGHVAVNVKDADVELAWHSVAIGDGHECESPSGETPTNSVPGSPPIQPCTHPSGRSKAE